jgi:ABC-type transporter Mla maintaining outer membrane lipid asymmetry ATPase subunit MlaF
MSVVLGYVPQAEVSGRIWLEAPGEHRVSTGWKDELLAAMLELRPRAGSRLFVLGAEVGALPEPERRALLGRVGFVPADGGLISSLNAWENISLPVSYHSPERIAGVFAEAQALLEELGGVDDGMLARLPEDLTPYEKRLAAFVRALLENPQLLVVEDLAAGLGPTKKQRIARFGEVYRRRCPGGTFVQIEE